MCWCSGSSSKCFSSSIRVVLFIAECCIVTANSGVLWRTIIKVAEVWLAILQLRERRGKRMKFIAVIGVENIIILR